MHFRPSEIKPGGPIKIAKVLSSKQQNQTWQLWQSKTLLKDNGQFTASLGGLENHAEALQTEAVPHHITELSQ